MVCDFLFVKFKSQFTRVFVTRSERKKHLKRFQDTNWTPFCFTNRAHRLKILTFTFYRRNAETENFETFPPSTSRYW